jgi:DNA-binding transcriptional MerR regulator
MATATTIYLTGKQRRGLFSRARRRRTSFSQEVRDALDLYLDLPPDFDEEDFAALAREANASLDRSIAKLDEAISRVKMTVRKLDEIDRRLDELAEKRI